MLLFLMRSRSSSSTSASSTTIFSRSASWSWSRLSMKRLRNSRLTCSSLPGGRCRVSPRAAAIASSSSPSVIASLLTTATTRSVRVWSSSEMGARSTTRGGCGARRGGGSPRSAPRKGTHTGTQAGFHWGIAQPASPRANSKGERRRAVLTAAASRGPRGRIHARAATRRARSSLRARNRASSSTAPCCRGSRPATAPAARASSAQT